MIYEIKEEDQSYINGGNFLAILGGLASAIAVADAAYDFYQGYSDHRH